MKQRIYSVAKLSVAIGALSLAVPSLAFASGEGEESALGIGLLLPKLGEFIPMLIAFVILWIILAKFAWPAFIGMIDKRAIKIKEAMESAETAKVESEELLAQHKAELIEAKKQAAEIVEVARQTAENIKSEITTSAQVEADNMLTQARVVIEAEKKAAIAELQGTAADLTVAVVKRVIGADLSDAEHRSIIKRYIAEAGSFNDN